MAVGLRGAFPCPIAPFFPCPIAPFLPSPITSTPAPLFPPLTHYPLLPSPAPFPHSSPPLPSSPALLLPHPSPVTCIPAPFPHSPPPLPPSPAPLLSPQPHYPHPVPSRAAARSSKVQSAALQGWALSTKLSTDCHHSTVHTPKCNPAPCGTPPPPRKPHSIPQGPAASPPTPLYVTPRWSGSACAGDPALCTAPCPMLGYPQHAFIGLVVFFLGGGCSLVLCLCRQ